MVLLSVSHGWSCGPASMTLRATGWNASWLVVAANAGATANNAAAVARVAKRIFMDRLPLGYRPRPPASHKVAANYGAMRSYSCVFLPLLFLGLDRAPLLYSRGASRG